MKKDENETIVGAIMEAGSAGYIILCRKTQWEEMKKMKMKRFWEQ